MTATVTIVAPTMTGTATSGRQTPRRAARYMTRSSTRMLQSVRAPIILEIGSNIIRVGYADSFQPLHLISVPSTDSASGVQGNATESQWYTILNPWIELVYDRLLCQPATRKVVVLHPQLVVPRTWKAALEKLLWNKGVPAMTFVSALELIPVAHGWKRGLIVHIARDEAVCVCHSDGYVLPFTYQSIPECGYQHLLDDVNTLQREWTSKMDLALLDEFHNPNSLVVALLKCLEACPRDIRYNVIHNMVFCGDGMMIFPDLGRKVAQRLEQILEGTQLQFTTPNTDTDTDTAAPAGDVDTTTSTNNQTTCSIPVSVKSLQSLATRLRLLSCAPHRPDFLAWIGSSLWAASWNRYEDEESRIKWKLAPSQQQQPQVQSLLL